MPSLTDALFAGGDTPQLVYGTIAAVSPLTVTVPPSTVAVPSAIVAGVHVSVGQKVAILQQGADRLIIGGTDTAPGVVALAERTTAQTGISGASDLTGLSLTFTAVAARRYKVTGYVIMLQVTSPGIAEVLITDGSGNELQKSTINQAVSTFATHHPQRVLSGLSGSQTIKLRAQTTAGTLETQSAATRPAFILIEDIGPA